MTVLSLTLDTPDLAQHYDNASVDRQFRAGKLLIERLAIQPGERVLDVGSGTGLLAEHVAGLVGPRGSVNAVDPLPLRIELAQKKARSNLTFAVDDAYKLERFADASFDVVYLNAVFHWFPEKRAPLQNFHRLLKQGGRLGIATGSRDHPNRIHDVKRKVLGRAPYVGYAQPESGQPLRVTADELRGLLEESGFEVRTLVVEPNKTVHASAEAAVQHSQASSFGNFLGHLPANLAAQARAEILAELEQLRTPEGITQEGARINVVAFKR